MPSPSLERFYPLPCPPLGFGASAIRESDIGRHYQRYRIIERWIREKCSFDSKNIDIADIGCGSGYGTNLLRVGLQGVVNVYGVEPSETARKYCAQVYPEVEIYNDIPEDRAPEVVVMVESIEHMTRAEAKCYLRHAQIAFITTPLVAEPDNEFHEQSFKTKEDVRRHMAHFRFRPTQEEIHPGVTFTTGERGAQYIGMYAYDRDVKPEKPEEERNPWRDEDDD